MISHGKPINWDPKQHSDTTIPPSPLHVLWKTTYLVPRNAKSRLTCVTSSASLSAQSFIAIKSHVLLGCLPPLPNIDWYSLYFWPSNWRTSPIIRPTERAIYAAIDAIFCWISQRRIQPGSCVSSCNIMTFPSLFNLFIERSWSVARLLLIAKKLLRFATPLNTVHSYTLFTWESGFAAIPANSMFAETPSEIVCVLIPRSSGQKKAFQ